MDFSAELDDLLQRAAHTKTAAQAAVSESREQLRQRIDQAKAAWTWPPWTPGSRSVRPRPVPSARWAQMKADAADAIEFAAWTVDHARLAVLDAIDT